MRNKFLAAIALLAVAFTFAASPASAQGGRTRGATLGVIDCTPGGASWPDWTYMGNPAYAAGRICGNPNVSPPAPAHVWDKRADGLCVAIWYRINQGATIYKATSAEACGYNVVDTGWTPSFPVWDVYLATAPPGATQWSQVTAWVQLY